MCVISLDVLNVHIPQYSCIVHRKYHTPYHRQELLSKDSHKNIFSLKSQKKKKKDNIQPVPQKTRVF